MLWIVLAVLGRIAGSVLASVWHKRLYQAGESSYRIVAVSMSIVAVVVWSFDCSFFSKAVSLGPLFWWFLFVSALLDTIGNVLLVRSIGAGDLSVVGPLNSYKPVFATILGMLFFHDRPSVAGGIGILAIMIGSWCLIDVGQRGASDQNKPNQMAVWIRLGSIAMTSTASLFLKTAISLSNSWMAFQGWAVMSAVFAWCLVRLLATPKHLSPHSSQVLYHVERGAIRRVRFADFLALGLWLILMQGLTIWLFSKMSVGYALALFQLSTLIQVVLGAKLFGEQNIGTRFFAACVMTLGAIVVLLNA